MFVITTRNPQANLMVERVHQMIGNMIYTFKYNEVDPDDPWSGILGAVAFAVCAMVHTTSKAMPSQLVFSRDAVLLIMHIANWLYIEKHKKYLITKNNECKNASCMYTT